MELFWNIFFWLVPIWVFVLIPFSSFYYEADDSAAMAAMVGVAAPARSRSRLGQALCSTAFVLVIFALLFFLTYLFLSNTIIPVKDYTGSTVQQAKNDYNLFFTTSQAQLTSNGTYQAFQVSELQDVTSVEAAMLDKVPNPKTEKLTLRVEFTTFYAGLMAFMGWFLFAIFGGIGISALPLDFILSFKNRPRHMTPEEFAEAKESIQTRVNEMVEIGEQLKRERDEQEKLYGGAKRSIFNSQHRKDAKAERNCMREFKAAVFLLEQDVADFSAASASNEKYNPLLPWLSLIMGIICSLISLAWIIHIGVYIVPKPPLFLFLNTYFQWFDNWFPLFGTLSIAIFTSYLLFCSIKGCFKFGLRFVCIE
jgi:LMBR1 domain-containing protein 1